MEVDLHTHSTYSDGTTSIFDNVKVARDKGITYFAASDHNVLTAQKDLIKASEQYKVNCIMGCEFSCEYGIEEIHMLGYFPLKTNFEDEKYAKIVQLSNQYAIDKLKSIEAMVNKLAEDFDVNYDEFYDYACTLKDNTNFNRNHIALYLAHKGIVANAQEAFDKYINEDKKYYIQKKNISVLDAARMVIEAGGLVSVAHLIQYDKKLKDAGNKTMLLDLAKLTPCLGVELYHSKHDEQTIRKYRQLAKEVENETDTHIFFTSGSDFHGKKKKDVYIQIGDFSQGEVSEEIKNLRQQDIENTIKVFKEYQIIG